MKRFQKIGERGAGNACGKCVAGIVKAVGVLSVKCLLNVTWGGTPTALRGRALVGEDDPRPRKAVGVPPSEF